MAKTITRTVCGLPDYMGCGLSVEVEDGVITRVRPGDFPDPADRGVCRKGLATREMVYHPDRLKYPLKRAGERGEGKWQRVSWDEALTDIAARLQEIGQRYGPGSVAWIVSVMPNLAGIYSRLASLTKGTLVDWWGCGDAAGPYADMTTFGYLRGETHLLSGADPRFIIVWGGDPAATNYHHLRQIVSARRKGARVVVIDPRFTATAARADEHIPIRPGTDGALALGMINVILQEGLRDKRFIAENTVGPLLVKRDGGFFLKESEVIPGGRADVLMIMDEYSGRRQAATTPQSRPAVNGSYAISGIECAPAFQLLSEMVKDYTPERVSRITDIPADVIRRLAVAYGSRRPASIFRGWGMQRTFHGHLSCRAINTLAAITGNINPERPSSFALNWQQFLLPGGPAGALPVMLLYDAITRNQPQTVKALWSSGHDFVNQMPNMNRVTEEVLRHLELVVVCDLFMTPSARFADYALPAASFYECTDLCTASFHHSYLQLQQKVIEPLHECRSDFHIAAELGKKLGLGAYFEKTEEQYIEDLLASGHPTMEGISLARLKEGPATARRLHRPSHFRTSTGLIEFYTERLKIFGQELPIYLEPLESARSEKARTYPLTLLTSRSANRMHSSLGRIPGLPGAEAEPMLEISPADARARDITDGDAVRVFNARGQAVLKARLSHRIKPGVVSIAQGWWPEQYLKGHHNELTHESVNPVQRFLMGPNAALYDVLVQVEKAPPSPGPR
jgi:anaerobic dimethyl sulfoxide reductase subunit A